MKERPLKMFALSARGARFAGTLACALAILTPGVIAAQINSPAISASDGILPGFYQCYASAGGQLTGIFSANFTILNANTYADAAGTRGSFSFDSKTSTLTFKGAAMDGQRALFEVFPDQLPNANILSARGDRGSVDCQFQP